MNAARAFFDTNALLYMYGGVDEKKRIQARDLFRRYAREGRIVLSTQEFYVAASRKPGIAAQAAEDAATALLELPLVVVGPAEILAAIANEKRYRISFWDALILAAAAAGGAEIVYTEDLNSGQNYGAVTVRNPFED